jgi:uncharacterized membrane protein
MRVGKWPIVLVASSLLAVFFTVADVQSPLRPLVALWFMLVCPGAAYVKLLRIDNSLIEMALIVSLSLSTGILVTEAMLYAHVWSVALGTAVLAGFCFVGVGLQIWQVQRNNKLSEPGVPQE